MARKKKTDGEVPTPTPPAEEKVVDEKIVELKPKNGSNVHHIGIGKVFARESELCDLLVNVCYEYEDISTQTAIGALFAAAMTLWADQYLTFEDE